jgi:cyclopropane-fatty-acyl-phospholipid synthase
MTDRNTSATAGQTGASPEAIRSHYDLGNEFFALWLDPAMVYSSALFEHHDDLSAAQIAKLDHHIAAARATGASRVLDIGCGWGALLDRLVTNAGVTKAVGLTLSAAQAGWTRARMPQGVEIREESWRDHVPERPYDAIISIGAFEHFTHVGMSSAAKLKAYREFFRWCSDALVPGGGLSLQTIAYTAPMNDDEQRRSAFITEKIFPESELPFIWEPIAAAEGLFELNALRNDRNDYFRTLRFWEQRLMARHDEAVALVGAPAVADFRAYLRMTAAAFKLGAVCLLRVGFTKRS